MSNKIFTLNIEDKILSLYRQLNIHTYTQNDNTFDIIMDKIKTLKLYQERIKKIENIKKLNIS